MLGLAGMLAAIVQAQLASRSHQARAEGLLCDYAAFAAGSYQQRVSESLTLAFSETLAPVFSAKGRPDFLAALTPDSLVAYELRGTTTCPRTPNYGAPDYFRLRPDDRELDVFSG